MTDQFSNNLKAFQSRWPAVSRLRPGLPVSIETLSDHQNRVSARCHGILLHSTHDPEKEARGFAQDITPGQRVCLYGFGLGYHIETLLDRLGSEGALTVIELNPDILNAALHLRNLTHLASDKRFGLVTGTNEEEVAAAISDALSNLSPEPGSSGLRVKVHIPSFQCLPPGFPKIANALEILRMEQRVPAIFGNLESGNYRLNRKMAKQAPGLNEYQGRHQNQAGLVISAGPSLDGLRPYLKWLRSRCVTACVDTTLPASSHEGFQPDYIFTLDPQDHSFEHFDDCLSSTATLVFTPTANPRVVRWFEGNKVVVFKENHSTTGQEQELMQEKGTTKSGGSVSCLGLDCLIQMGCNPIILVGQDCAFSGDRIHATGMGVSAHTWNTASSLQTASQDHHRETRRSKRVSVESCQGPLLWTSQVMYSYLRTVEQIAATHPDVAILNLASHGANIDHVQNVGSPGELMEFLSKRGMLDT